MKSKKKILIISLSVLLAVSLIAAGIVLIAAGSGKVTVNFETNGGAAISSVEVKKGEEISLPQPEARTGYEFNGWYENEDLSGDAIKSAVVNNNVTYYASWEKLGVITLQLDGGNLSSTVLYLKKGANVEAFMRDYVPQKSEHEFGGWYIGEDALSGTLAMAEAVTLTAKYKVAYTVEIFKQNTALNGYEKAKEAFVGYDFAGTSVTPVPAVEGFGVTANPNSVSTIVLSETPSQNKLVLYYDREVYSVLFHSNYPDGSENRTVTVNAIYGIPQEVPSDYFKVTGYVQTGWSESAFSGNVDYPVDIIKNSLYNSEEQAAVSYLDVKGNTFLYAVWNKGYSDMYGGDDHVYRLSEDSSEIYLERGEKFFVGSYNKTSGRFTFRKANDDVLMSGILNDDGTFIYRDIERSETSATRFLPNIGLDENERIFFNEYNGLEYQANGESSSGIYTIENGEYAVLFNDGPLSGQTRHFTVEERDINGGNVRVFFLRNEEQYAMGKIYRMASGGRYYREYYTVTLSGYLTATFIMPDSDGNASEVIYTYFTSEDGKTVTLQTSGGATAGVMKLFDMSGTMAGYTGYMLYSSDYDRVYTSSSGQTLTLDGVNSAEYFNGETTITGEYEISASLLGGNIVTVTAGEAPNVSTYKFIIDSVTTDEPVVIDGSSTGETQSVTEYVFEVKNPGYAEYYYSDYAGVYYAPLLVIDDPVGGAAAVYGRNSARAYVKVSEGTVEDVSGNKVYTRSKVYEAEVSTSPIDISSVKSFQFLTGSRAVSSGSYNVNYWFSYVNEDDETVPVAVSYNEKGNGGGKLLLAGGFAKYTVEGNTFTAQYSLSGNLLTFSYLNGMVTNNVYIEIDEENREFLLLDGAPYTAVRYGINGSAAEGETLSYNGKGGYVYSVAAEGDGEPVTYNGTSESTGFSYGGTEVYTFASEGITFEYVFITVSGKVYFIMRDTERGAQYENGDTKLILDGYGLYSTYVAEDGTEYSGAYLIEEENVVLMESGSEKYRFDLSDNGFTLRGKEYGSYLLRDNFEYKYLVRLNGYGKLSVYSLDDTENPVDGDGDYYVNGEFITIVFNEGITEKTFEGKFTVGTIGGNVYNVFAVSHSVSVSTFVSPEDWTVLVLDDIGNAVSYDKKGRKQNGTYIFITENMLYFVNDAENEACIYNYDLQTGIAYPSVFKERGYFTSSSSLDSLLFSKYGFAMFDGERLYYNVVDDNVIIYRRNVSDPSANEYGFVAENFGPFTATKNFNEKTYYASDGFAIEFTRKTESASKYPVKIQDSDELIPLEKLSFSPNGNDTYRVAGTIVVGGESYPCYVNRAQRENGTYYLYVTNGNLRFDITVEYHGMNEDGDFTDCVYEIDSMSSSVTYQAYRYLYYYYYYNYFGMTLQNSFGVLTESRNFNEDGEVSASYLSGSFYTDSGIYDARGSLISFETDDYGAYGAGDIVKAVFTADDGFEYNLYYTVQMHPYLRSYGYLIYAVTRTERLTAEDGYTFIAERIVASDYNLSQGLYFSVSLEKDGEEIPFSNLVRLRNEYYYISRATDEDGKYVSSAYYRLDFVEDIPEELGENVSLMPAYKSVKVTKESVDMYITEDGTGFAEFKEDTLIILCFNGTEYFSSETVKDEDSGVYTVITTSGDVFTLKIDNGKAVIEKAEDEDGEDQTV